MTVCLHGENRQEQRFLYAMLKQQIISKINESKRWEANAKIQLTSVIKQLARIA